MDNRPQITICGGGNGAHAFAVTISAKFSPRYRVNWLSLHGGDRIGRKLQENDGFIKGIFCNENAEIKGKICIGTNDPSQVIPNSDIIILCVPAFGHKPYLDAINKYHEMCVTKNFRKSNCKNLIIAAFPGESGLEFEFKSILNNYENIVLFSCLTLPWTCKIINYGESVKIIGIKEELSSIIYGNQALLNELQPLQQLQSLFLDNKPVLKCDGGNILSSSLGATNPIIHSAIMYTKWNEYDLNKPELFAQESIPLFYHSISQRGADTMTQLGDEMVAIGSKYNEIGRDLESREKEYKHNLISFPHINDWYFECYANGCSDSSSLYDIIRTNPCYNGILYPMKKYIGSDNVNQYYVPDFGHRFMSEDIPFGLLVTKSMALILDEYDNGKYSVKTPTMDKILLWAQKIMNKRYFIVHYDDSNNVRLEIDMNSKDIKQTRIPQLFGLKTVQDLLILSQEPQINDKHIRARL